MTTKSTSRRGEERAAGLVLYHGCRPRRYLLLRHRNGEHWAFPKGRIEDGENAEQAARRETLEETGIGTLEMVSGFQETSRYRLRRADETIDKSVVYYLAEVKATFVRLSREHTDSAWLVAEEARQALTFDEGRRILDRAEARLESEAEFEVEEAA